jgi:hypothetical protein
MRAGDRDKDVEILALRHQITVLERQLGADRVKLAPEERAFLADAGIQTVRCGVRVPRVNAIMERWVQSCRRELLDRTLTWNATYAMLCSSTSSSTTPIGPTRP